MIAEGSNKLAGPNAPPLHQRPTKELLKDI
jgi:hypothetical protein